MNKIALSLSFLIITNSLNAIWKGCNGNKSTETTSLTEQLIKNQQEEKLLKVELYELESSIIKKQFSVMNPIREKAAFLIAIVGLGSSFIIPFKLVKNNPQHRLRTCGKRLAVMAATICATTVTACAIEFFRPIIWFGKIKRDRLKKKIFDLETAHIQTETQKEYK